jgi:hypothetical protein
MDDDTRDETHDLPRTTTTGDEREDYRHRGDSSVQDADRDEPTAADPKLASHSEDDPILPKVEDEDDDEDRADEEQAPPERPSGNLTSRSYGESTP